MKNKFFQSFHVLSGISLFLCTPLLAQTPESQMVKQVVIDQANQWLGRSAPYLKLNYTNNDNRFNKDGWSVDYDWKKSKSRIDVPDTNLDGLKEGEKRRFRYLESALKANIKGSYAYNDSSNVNNLSTSGLAFHISVIDQGYLVKMSDDNRQQAVNCINTLPTPGVDNINREQYNSAVERCYQPYRELLLNQASHHYAYDIKFDYHIEANENYTQHQEVYGLGLTFLFEPYASSTLQTLNIFDFPFRYLTRAFFSADNNYNSRYPSIHLAYENVDPSKNQIRNSLPGGLKSYNRFSGELAYTSQVATLGGYPINVEMSYRIYQEISAPDAVKQLNIDKFHFGKIAFFAPASLLGFNLPNHEFHLTYFHGELPFDINTNEALQLGWKSNFSDIAKALLLE